MRHKATPLSPEKREWVKKYLAGLELQGVIERVSHAEFAANVVLVEGGQHG